MNYLTPTNCIDLNLKLSPTAAIEIPATPDVLIKSGTGHPSLPWWGGFSPVNYRYSAIHGNHALPDGYHWVIPSPTFCFHLVERLKGRAETKISCSQNTLQIITSIIQLAVSSITIYHTRGPQLDRYGYASFGLSVIPFTFMSFVNFICVGSTGSYPSLFMLQTSTLQEAKRRSGAEIFGEVGILPMAQDCQHNNRQSHNLAGLDRAHDEADEPLVDGGMASRDDKNIPACLWAEDNRKYLCVKIGGLTRRFKLVKSDNEEPTFIFLIHPMDNRFFIREPKAEPGGELFSLRRLLLFLLLPTTPLFGAFRQAMANSKYQTQVLLGLKAFIAITSPFFALVLPYILISFLTGFQKQQSTIFERLVMTSWVVANQVWMLGGAPLFMLYPPLSIFQFHDLVQLEKASLRAWDILLLTVTVPFGLIIYYGPSIAGFVVVGKMLHEFGTCSLTP
jgi:hypothetical protein